MNFKDEKEINDEFDELLKNAPDDKFGKLLKDAAKKEMDVSAKEFFLDRGPSADLIVSKIENLNLFFYENCSQIYKLQSNTSNITMFYIQLWIFVDELPKYFTKTVNQAKLYGELIGIDKEYIQLGEEVIKALDQFKRTFHEDEILTIEYLRIMFSHLESSKYVIQYNPKNKTFSKDVNGIYRADIRKRIKSTLDAHNSNYKNYAFFLTQKINAPLNNVYEAITRWVSNNYEHSKGS